MSNGYLYLAAAILGETAATTALKSAEDFTRLVPSLVVIAGYAAALYFLSMTLRSVPVAVAYAIWAGAGTTLIAIMGWAVHSQALDWRAIAGMALIIAGVTLINSSASSLLR